MSIKISNYGGLFGWYMRRVFPDIASFSYIHLQYITRHRLTQRYINSFNSLYLKPLIVSIETINKCNNSCSFCPANKNADSRPFMKMDIKLFKKIISDLKNWNYSGYISVYVNNEPFMDDRIVDFYKYIKEEIPNAQTLLFTNGLLLTLDKFKNIYKYIDTLIINNYNTKPKLHDNIREIYKYVKENDSHFESININIQLRYINEVLTNRAGNSPNKRIANKIQTELCLLPYTDLTIYPNGTVGLCCSDAKEVTNYGNLSEISIQDIWNSTQLKTIRENIKLGRDGNSFCKFCDFVDAGIRIKIIKKLKKEFPFIFKDILKEGNLNE
jgi:radical SAM protein with 4Fe4S-binding SPASM domain